MWGGGCEMWLKFNPVFKNKAGTLWLIQLLVRLGDSSDAKWDPDQIPDIENETKILPSRLASKFWSGDRDWPDSNVAGFRQICRIKTAQCLNCFVLKQAKFG